MEKYEGKAERKVEGVKNKGKINKGKAERKGKGVRN